MHKSRLFQKINFLFACLFSWKFSNEGHSIDVLGSRETFELQLITFITDLEGWKCKHYCYHFKKVAISQSFPRGFWSNFFLFLNPIECVFVCGCFLFLFSFKPKTEKWKMCLMFVGLCAFVSDSWTQINRFFIRLFRHKNFFFAFSFTK